MDPKDESLVVSGSTEYLWFFLWTRISPFVLLGGIYAVAEPSHGRAALITSFGFVLYFLAWASYMAYWPARVTYTFTASEVPARHGGRLVSCVATGEIEEFSSASWEHGYNSYLPGLWPWLPRIFYYPSAKSGGEVRFPAILIMDGVALEPEVARVTGVPTRH